MQFQFVVVVVVLLASILLVASTEAEAAHHLASYRVVVRERSKLQLHFDRIDKMDRIKA